MVVRDRITIIGGGLSGLTLAYFLSKRNINATVIEGSSRLGGRIQTVKGKLETPMELGATWFSDMHLNLLSLMEELGLKKYPQFSKGISLFQTEANEPPQKFSVPEGDIPSYRIVGGTQMLIEALKEKLDAENILLNNKVTALKEVGNELSIETSNGKSLFADKVVLCMPPQLASLEIKISPKLPENLLQILPNVQTWMAGSIKFAVEYKEPFWRNKGFSGMVYSHIGIVAEMYDHTDFEENKFGFTGFLNGAASKYPQDQRKKFVLNQLAELLGKKILNPVAYFDKVWTDEFVLAGNQTIQRPHQNNGHPLLQQSYLNGKLLFAGTETATEYSGYMEGAIRSAQKIADRFAV